MRLCGHILALAGLLGAAHARADALPNETSVLSSPACAEAQAGERLRMADAIAQAVHSQPKLLVAQQDLEISRAGLLGSYAPFLPVAQMTAGGEDFVPKNGSAPVVITGNNVLGGPQAKSTYASASVSWSIFNGGRDLAAYRGAGADVRASRALLADQEEETIDSVMKAYASLYEAEVSVTTQTHVFSLLRAILARSEERFENGHGTTVAIGQARNAALDAERQLNRACRDVRERGSALAVAMGIDPEAGSLTTAEGLPTPHVGIEYSSLTSEAVNHLVEVSPTVLAARAKVAAAEARLQFSERSFAPTVSLAARKEYLGEDVASFGAATRRIGPYDYRVGLTVSLPILPMLSEIADVRKARAELRKAQAEYTSARIATSERLQDAVSAEREARASYLAAYRSQSEAQSVVSLTGSLYRAGRADLDELQRAEIDRDRADGTAATLSSELALSEWETIRAMRPGELYQLALQQFSIELQIQ